MTECLHKEYIVEYRIIMYVERPNTPNVISLCVGLIILSWIVYVHFYMQ